MRAEKNSDTPVKRYHRVLTIAGSDSCGGAGIQADLKTFAANGCYGMSVLTALTAQNTTGVSAIHAVPPAFVRQQVEAVFSDIGVDAVKIGMLFSADLIETVADQLECFHAPNIVLDPVMVAQSGDKLLQDSAISAIKNRLMPLADVVTPNLPEAAVLLDREIGQVDDMKQAAGDLARFGSRSVLVKGGHLEDQACPDLLYLVRERRHLTLSGRIIPTINNHGTGCTLSSAIAANLAKGSVIETAVLQAKTYITGAIRAGAGYCIGEGHGPVHHFYRFWE